MQHYRYLIPKYSYKGLTNKVRFTFSVGDTTQAVKNKYWVKANGIDDTKYDT